MLMLRGLLLSSSFRSNQAKILKPSVVEGNVAEIRKPVSSTCCRIILESISETETFADALASTQDREVTDFLDAITLDPITSASSVKSAEHLEAGSQQSLQASH